MTTESIGDVSVATKANVYFDGKCVSHGITFADGRKCTVGVILPSILTFSSRTTTPRPSSSCAGCLRAFR